MKPSYRRKRPEPSAPEPQSPPRSQAYFQGRGWAGHYDASDDQARLREMDRQHWSYEITQMSNEFAGVDPVAEYERHRQAYEATGNLGELRLALEYLRP